MSRKYKQRGYQEAEGGGARGAQKTPDRRRDGPGGRGLGAPTESAFKCARCGAVHREGVEFVSICSGCGSDLHTCTNCKHFDTALRNECREQVPVRITAKAKRNECGLFAPRAVQGFAADEGPSSEEAKTAFDALFDL